MGKHDAELFDLLRSRGVRRKVAKPIAALDGNARRAGSRGEKLALQAVDDLSSAAQDIRTRVLHVDRKRSQGSRKAAQTRGRTATKRKAAAKKAAQTRKSDARRTATKRKAAAKKGARTRKSVARARSRGKTTSRKR